MGINQKVGENCSEGDCVGERLNKRVRLKEGRRRRQVNMN